MKRVLSVLMALLFVVSLPICAYAEIPMDKVLEQSQNPSILFKSILNIAIAKKQSGEEGEVYSRQLGADLMSFSLEELEQIRAIVFEEADSTDDNPLDGIDIEPFSGFFTKEDALQFSLFKSVWGIADQLGWLVTPLVTREGNPELSFDVDKQEIDYARFYLVYYANVSKTEAKEAVEEYSDKFAAVLSALYPNISADLVCFFWKIPVISEDSLYSASFYYHTEDSALVRNEK